MPVKLQLSFAKTAPKGDTTTICLIGKNGEIIPHLEKDIAAYLIAAMATAQFTGKSGKSLGNGAPYPTLGNGLKNTFFVPIELIH